METLEKIVTTVDVRLPEFSELQDCFREVRRLWAGGWASGNGGRPNTHTSMSVYTHSHVLTHTREHAHMNTHM